MQSVLMEQRTLVRLTTAPASDGDRSSKDKVIGFTFASPLEREVEAVFEACVGCGNT